MDGNGRLTGEVGQASVQATPTQLIGPDEMREAIMFTCGSATPAFLSNNPKMAANTGLVILNSQGVVEMRREHYGDLVGKEWWGITAGGTSYVGYAASRRMK